MVNLNYRALWYSIDALWLAMAGLYVLAGTSLVPFHGDESTTIWMSKDYGYIFLNDQLDRVRFTDPPVDPPEQHLRLITGSLTKYLMGISWSSNGYSTDQINEQWHWGFDWDWNLENGHIPDHTLLMYGRWPSAVMLAASVIVLFVIGQCMGGRWIAYPASLYYALNPAVLLNGRRAMFEGGFLLFALLLVWAGLLFMRERAWKRAAFLGLGMGLALSAKHTAVFTIFAVGIAVIMQIGLEYRSHLRRTWRDIFKLAAAGLLGMSIFYTLHPIWWGNPFERVVQVYDGRRAMLSDQITNYGDYDDFLDQIRGFVDQVFVAQPQYFEVAGWEDFISQQITRYENTLWDGIALGGSRVGAVIIAVVALVGLWRMMVSGQYRQSDRLLLSFWSLTIIFTALLFTPLEWQRYYILVYPAVALLMAAGVRYVIVSASAIWRGEPQSP